MRLDQTSANTHTFHDFMTHTQQQILKLTTSCPLTASSAFHRRLYDGEQDPFCSPRDQMLTLTTDAPRSGGDDWLVGEDWVRDRSLITHSECSIISVCRCCCCLLGILLQLMADVSFWCHYPLFVLPCQPPILSSPPFSHVNRAKQSSSLIRYF